MTPHTLLEILASSLTNILPFLTKLHLSLKPVTITFVNFAVSDLTSIHHLPLPLLPLLFTLSSITVILSTTNSLSLNYPVSSRSRTLLLVLSWKLPSHVISLISQLRSIHWLRIIERTEYKLLSLTYKVLTTTQLPYFITSSLFNVHAVLALHPSLLLLGHIHHPVWKQLIALFVMLHHVSGISSISSSTSFWYQFLHFRLTYSFTHHFLFRFTTWLCLSITLYLFHSRLKTYLFLKSYQRSFTSSSRTAFMDFYIFLFAIATNAEMIQSSK